ncbi:MAG: hypothetical protein SGCHY_003635, partial [Lobulomycetales sp.]
SLVLELKEKLQMQVQNTARERRTRAAQTPKAARVRKILSRRPIILSSPSPSPPSVRVVASYESDGDTSLDGFIVPDDSDGLESDGFLRDDIIIDPGKHELQDATGTAGRDGHLLVDDLATSTARLDLNGPVIDLTRSSPPSQFAQPSETQEELDTAPASQGTPPQPQLSQVTLSHPQFSHDTPPQPKLSLETAFPIEKAAYPRIAITKNASRSITVRRRRKSSFPSDDTDLVLPPSPTPAPSFPIERLRSPDLVFSSPSSDEGSPHPNTQLPPQIPSKNHTYTNPKKSARGRKLDLRVDLVDSEDDSVNFQTPRRRRRPIAASSTSTSTDDQADVSPNKSKPGIRVSDKVKDDQADVSTDKPRPGKRVSDKVKDDQGDVSTDKPKPGKRVSDMVKDDQADFSPNKPKPGKRVSAKVKDDQADISPNKAKPGKRVSDKVKDDKADSSDDKDFGSCKVRGFNLHDLCETPQDEVKHFEALVAPLFAGLDLNARTGRGEDEVGPMHGKVAPPPEERDDAVDEGDLNTPLISRSEESASTPYGNMEKENVVGAPILEPSPLIPSKKSPKSAVPKSLKSRVPFTPILPKTRSKPFSSLFEDDSDGSDGYGEDGDLILEPSPLSPLIPSKKSPKLAVSNSPKSAAPKNPESAVPKSPKSGVPRSPKSRVPFTPILPKTRSKPISRLFEDDSDGSDGYGEDGVLIFNGGSPAKLIPRNPSAKIEDAKQPKVQSVFPSTPVISRKPVIPIASATPILPKTVFKPPSTPFQPIQSPYKKRDREFMKNRERLSHELYTAFNARIFEKKLASGPPVTWSKTLNTTAGRCLTKRAIEEGKVVYQARIELSCKVIDDLEKLKETLVHEMCHDSSAAAWVIDKTNKPPHGPAFKKWGAVAEKKFPSIKVTTCHSYEINYRFYYTCVNEQCGAQFGRHSKSIDVDRVGCGRCGSRVRFVERTRQDGTAVKKNQFSEFMRQEYTSVKQRNPGTSHGDIMKMLSVAWKERKKGL